jgi:hypothetical protein
MDMSGRRKKGPDKAFIHSDDCKIYAADPTVSIEWSELEGGHWQAVCVCGARDHYEPVAGRLRLDPLDPKTGRHLGQCEFSAESDPAVLRVVLKATEKEGYWWVTCGACDAGWQVPH